jgi:hypothetical protein
VAEYFSIFGTSGKAPTVGVSLVNYAKCTVIGESLDAKAKADDPRRHG